MPRLTHRKHPTHIEAKMNTPIKPITTGFGDEAFFNHGGAVGKVELKNVPAGFDIEANAETIPVAGDKLIR